MAQGSAVITGDLRRRCLKGVPAGTWREYFLQQRPQGN